MHCCVNGACVMKSTCLTIFAESICCFTQSLQIMAHVHEKVPVLLYEGYLIIHAYWHFFSIGFFVVWFCRVPDKASFQPKYVDIFLIFHKNKICDYSSEPSGDVSIVYPQQFVKPVPQPKWNSKGPGAELICQAIYQSPQHFSKEKL